MKFDRAEARIEAVEDSGQNPTVGISGFSYENP